MITKNSDGTYTADVYPNDEHWKSKWGQLFLEMHYSIERDLINGAMEVKAFLEQSKEIVLEIESMKLKELKAPKE